MYENALPIDLSYVADPEILISARADESAAFLGSSHPLNFTFADIRSAERMMAMTMLDLNPNMLFAAQQEESITIACCCTPCCCAAAVMVPVKTH